MSGWKKRDIENQKKMKLSVGGGDMNSRRTDSRGAVDMGEAMSARLEIAFTTMRETWPAYVGGNSSLRHGNMNILFWCRIGC